MGYFADSHSSCKKLRYLQTQSKKRFQEYFRNYILAIANRIYIKKEILQKNIFFIESF